MSKLHIEHDAYCFQWVGKANAKLDSQTNGNTQIEAHLAASIDFHQSKNVFIEGENLEALKLLQHAYAKRVKLIYIDPPYNTGNQNFAYDDSFKESKNSFTTRKKKDNFNHEQSFKTENEKALERHHSAWLSMMYSRLLLAHTFLTDDGVILISIDDGELAHLKLVCDEIFGLENFIGNMVWHNRTTPNDAGIRFANDHEYIVAYAKNKKLVQFQGQAKDLKKYKNPDNDSAGDWIADNPSAASGNEKYRFPIENPFTGQIYFPPKGRYWAFAAVRVAQWQESGKLVFPKVKSKNFLLKKYKSELKSHQKPMSSVITGILTSFGTKELKSLFNDASPFKYPKPSELIKLLIQQLTTHEDIILDFFAGSGTTAHACIEANLEDNQKRSFLLVQMPEQYASLDKDMNKKYNTVSEVTIIRIQKTIAHYAKNKSINADCLNLKCFQLKPQIKHNHFQKMLQCNLHLNQPMIEHEHFLYLPEVKTAFIIEHVNEKILESVLQIKPLSFIYLPDKKVQIALAKEMCTQKKINIILY
jgi:adenine-specific DNA-methyltransferase